MQMEKLWDLQVTSSSLPADLCIINIILGRNILKQFRRKKGNSTLELL